MGKTSRNLHSGEQPDRRGSGGESVAPRTRNIGLRRIRVADIEDHSLNFRTHPQAQRDALAGTVNEIGFYGYPDCYETEDGTIRLIDGHLRKSLLVEKYGPDATIEVNVTDFNESEARKAMLTHDPLASMAEMDAGNLDELLRSVETGDEALSKMLSDLAIEAGVIPEDEQEVELRRMEYTTPPERAWVLIGLPIRDYGAIEELINAVNDIPDSICETTVN